MNMELNNKSLEQERKELNALIGKGVTFTLEDVEFVTQKRFFGLVKKRVQRKVTHTFTIAEPTLATLDRLSSEWIEFAIDEAKLKSDDAMTRARSLTHEHAMRCAKVIAIAVMGETRLIPEPCKGGVRWIEDAKALDDLTSLFARKIKPSDLNHIYVMISAMCNLGDFLNSIRLMSTERTTMPIRIEEHNEG